jgi:hypothetical protein
VSVRSDWPAFAGLALLGRAPSAWRRRAWHLCMLDGSIVSVEFDKDPKVSKLSRGMGSECVTGRSTPRPPRRHLLASFPMRRGGWGRTASVFGP